MKKIVQAGYTGAVALDSATGKFSRAFLARNELSKGHSVNFLFFVGLLFF